MREYKNFKQIERDLQLLKLHREIEKEKILLNYHESKENLAPMNLLKSAGRSLLKNALILKGTTSILGFIGDKFKK